MRPYFSTSKSGTHGTPDSTAGPVVLNVSICGGCSEFNSCNILRNKASTVLHVYGIFCNLGLKFLDNSVHIHFCSCEDI